MKHTKGCFAIVLSFFIIFGLGFEDGHGQDKKYETLLGSWDAVVQTDGGDYYFTFTFQMEDDSLSGTFSSELGDSPLENIKFEEKGLTCDFTIDMADGEMYLDVDCEIEGDEMTGTMGSDMGEFPMSATKGKEEEKKN